MNGTTALDHIKVLDLGLGLAGALSAKLLMENGATITRIEPPTGDPFYLHYPAYSIWQNGKTVRTATNAPGSWIDAELVNTNILVIGGEDYPGLDWKFDADSISARHPGLIILDLGGHSTVRGAGMPPAVELLAQAYSGLCNEQFENRPLAMAFPAASYAAALLGVGGVLAALFSHRNNGKGQVVATSLLGGALAWCAPLWPGMPGPDETFPKASRQLIFTCSDGHEIQVAPGTPGGLEAVHDILGVQERPSTRWGTRKGLDQDKNFWGNADLLEPFARKWPSADLMLALRNKGVPVEHVKYPGECWNDEQVLNNGVIQHTVDGTRYVGSTIGLAAANIEADIKTFREKRDHLAGTGPLAGLRVLDLGAFVAGPYASRSLADMGAEVIKVEPLDGDVSRSSAQTFAAINRGKKSIAVDIKSKPGQEIVRRLCLSADIVQHNFRPGVAARLGIDASTLHKIKPSLIVMELTAYGKTGPMALYPGLDMIFQAYCGHEKRAGGPGNPPLWYRICIVDYGAGMLGSIASLLGIINLDKEDGRGAEVSINLLDTALFLMSELVESSDGFRVSAPPTNATQTGQHPAEGFYEAEDGWIALAVRGQEMADRLLRALSIVSDIDNPYSEWSEKESAIIGGAVRTRKIAELGALLDSNDVWATECRRLEGWLSADTDQKCKLPKHIIERGNSGSEYLGPTYEFTGTPLSPPMFVPKLGQHTRELLRECGFSTTEIDNLYSATVI